MTFVWRLRMGAKIPAAKFVRCYLELFLGEGNNENPRKKINSATFVSGSRLCHGHRMSVTTNFFLTKKEWPDRARNVPYYYWSRSEPDRVCGPRPWPLQPWTAAVCVCSPWHCLHPGPRPSRRRSTTRPRTVTTNLTDDTSFLRGDSKL
jgi:hypothetical protein